MAAVGTTNTSLQVPILIDFGAYCETIMVDLQNDTVKNLKHGFKDGKKAIVDLQRHAINLTAASVEGRLWCLCVVPKMLN